MSPLQQSAFLPADRTALSHGSVPLLAKTISSWLGQVSKPDAAQAVEVEINFCFIEESNYGLQRRADPLQRLQIDFLFFNTVLASAPIANRIVVRLHREKLILDMGKYLTASHRLISDQTGINSP